jgi:hypothetical protein
MKAMISFDLVDDIDALAKAYSTARIKGDQLICGRCKDSDELVIGLMTFKANRATLPLCGPCWQRLPTPRYVA